MIYYLLALSDDGSPMFIFFVLIILILLQVSLILELFYFQLMDLIIERWFPIKLDTLYKMK